MSQRHFLPFSASRSTRCIDRALSPVSLLSASLHTCEHALRAPTMRMSDAQVARYTAIVQQGAIMVLARESNQSLKSRRDLVKFHVGESESPRLFNDELAIIGPSLSRVPARFYRRRGVSLRTGNDTNVRLTFLRSSAIPADKRVCNNLSCLRCLRCLNVECRVTHPVEWPDRASLAVPIVPRARFHI
jgi:hypothetical protein